MGHKYLKTSSWTGMEVQCLVCRLIVDRMFVKVYWHITQSFFRENCNYFIRFQKTPQKKL